MRSRLVDPLAQLVDILPTESTHAARQSHRTNEAGLLPAPERVLMHPEFAGCVPYLHEFWRGHVRTPPVERPIVGFADVPSERTGRGRRYQECRLGCPCTQCREWPTRRMSHRGHGRGLLRLACELKDLASQPPMPGWS